MTDGLTASDVALIQGNGRNSSDDMFGGNGAWWIVLFLIFGWGRGNGYGGGYGGSDAGAANNYVLASDFATIQRQLSDGFNSIDNALDRQSAGICDLGYTQAQLINGVNTTVMQGNYATQTAINGIGTQLASCCCDIREGISNVNYNNAMNANNIQRQISDCCCSTDRQIERGFADTNYNMATQNCATLQAIDKVGDRVIDYLANEKLQTLRDENFALRLSASQQAQNAYLVDQLGYHCPQAAYIVQPPQQVTFPVNCCGVTSYGANGCGCGNIN